MKNLSRRSFLRHIITGAGSILSLDLMSSCVKRSNKPTVTEFISNNATIVWKYEQGPFDVPEVRAAIDKAMQRRGLAQHIDFQKMEVAPILGTSKPLDISGADIISMPANDAINGLRRFTVDYARKGYFCRWNDYLLTEEGKILVDALPDNYWKGCLIDGSCYGLVNYSPQRKRYAVFNKRLLDKYNLMNTVKTSMPMSFTSIMAMVKQVKAGEEASGNSDLLPFSLPYFSFYQDILSIMGCDGLGVRKESGKWIVRLLLDFPEFHDYLSEKNQNYQAGLFTGGRTAMIDGNFFMLLVSSYSEEAAIRSARKLTRNQMAYPDGEYGEPEEAYGIAEEECVAIKLDGLWDEAYRGHGNYTVVSEASSYKENCLQILKEIYTDPELTELFMYGVDGISYKTVGGLPALFGTNYQHRYGNVFLARPTTEDSPDKIDQYEDYFSEPVHALCGFHFREDDVSQEMLDVTRLYVEHLNFYRGYSSNMKDEEKIIREELAQAGVNRLIEEMQKQISDFFDQPLLTKEGSTA